jgi:hypothetical protein
VPRRLVVAESRCRGGAARREVPPAQPAELVAALIGLSAVIGSVATWRAEEASRVAEHADRRGGIFVFVDGNPLGETNYVVP